MTFTEWLATQTARAGDIGFLAQCVQLDTCWPAAATEKTQFEAHLLDAHGVGAAALAALATAWDEYERALRFTWEPGDVQVE